jgi:hypothetical protein
MKIETIKNQFDLTCAAILHLSDEIGLIAFFHRDESNTRIISIKDATLEITIFFSFFPNLLN